MSTFLLIHFLSLTFFLFPSPKQPKPHAIGSPEPPKELAFSAPGKKFLGVLLPPASSALGGPNTCKHQHEQVMVTKTPLPISNIHSELMAGPFTSAKPTACKVSPKKNFGPKNQVGPRDLPPSESAATPAPSGSRLRKMFRKSPVPNTYKNVQSVKKPHFYPSSSVRFPSPRTSIFA
ncbi:hypothetical protein EDD18DRAFT_1358208 [Armillaria luteobubalina]|uniref:Uncharacterized protein n=1 Tax=Armillaria luteobubalina TaxID=153913 RepID=A0AA39UTG5_9AGAR|nr:hypothetical protein EDD18DRAFT_1358208 [Armillaria luteobubalina]